MNKITNANVLITGSSGFLGSKAVNYLAKKIYVRSIYGVDIRKSHKLPLSPKIKQYIEDLSLQKSSDILEDLNFDFIIHAAADQSSRNMLKNNINQMKNLIKIAKKKSVKKFIFVSSSWADTDSQAPYPQSKKICEKLLIKSSLPYTIIRPDTLFGLGEWKMETIKKYAKMRVGIIVGSGNYLRSPTYVYDLIKIFDTTIREILRSKNIHKFQKIYDIGSPNSYSQNDIVRLVGRHYKKDVFLFHIPKIIARILFTIQGKLDPELVKDVEIDRTANLSKIEEDYDIGLIDFKNGLKYLDYDEH